MLITQICPILLGQVVIGQYEHSALATVAWHPNLSQQNNENIVSDLMPNQEGGVQIVVLPRNLAHLIGKLQKEAQCRVRVTAARNKPPFLFSLLRSALLSAPSVVRGCKMPQGTDMAEEEGAIPVRQLNSSRICGFLDGAGVQSVQKRKGLKDKQWSSVIIMQVLTGGKEGNEINCVTVKLESPRIVRMFISEGKNVL